MERVWRTTREREKGKQARGYKSTAVPDSRDASDRETSTCTRAKCTPGCRREREVKMELLCACVCLDRASLLLRFFITVQSSKF